MQISEQFSTVIRRCAIVVVLSVGLLLVYKSSNVPAEVHAQNAGNVGIQTNFVPVFAFSEFTGAGTYISGGTWQCGVASGHCPYLPDIGQGVSALFFCTTTYSGTIDFEYNPNPALGNFVVLSQASFTNDTGCHSLTMNANSYVPNLRVKAVATNAGGFSAYYSGVSGPVSPFAPAIGTNGPTSPIQCDRNVAVSIAGGGTGLIVGPINTGDTIVICNMSVSFAAAPSGSVSTV